MKLVINDIIKGLIIGFVIILIFGFGLATFFILTSSGHMGYCTQKACQPMIDNFTGEIPCNSCSKQDPIFTLVFVTLWNKCTTIELMEFENGKMIDTRIDEESWNCRYRWEFI